MKLPTAALGLLVMLVGTNALKCSDVGTKIGSGLCGAYTVGTSSIRGIQANATAVCELAACPLGATFTAYEAGCTCADTNSGGTLYVDTATAGTCTICTKFNEQGAMLQGDPHLQGFNGEKFLFKGRNSAVFALISNVDHQVNSLFDSLGEGMDADTWMMAYGIRYRDTTFTIELQHAGKPLETFIDPEAAHLTKKRMRVAGSHNHLPLFAVTINDMVLDKAVHSGQAVTSGRDDVVIYFPLATQVNPEDRTDGPIAVVRTPDMEFTIYYETEDALHLDINVAIISPQVLDVDGVIGQTLSWAMDDEAGGAHNHTIHGSDAEYEVADGLLGSNWTYNLFGKKDGQTGEVGNHRRELSTLASGIGCSAGRIGSAQSSLLPMDLLSRRRLGAGATQGPRRFAGSIGRVGSASSLLKHTFITSA